MWKLVRQCSVYTNPDFFGGGSLRSDLSIQSHFKVSIHHVESVQLAVLYSPYPFLIFCIYDGHSAASVASSPTLYICVYYKYTQISSSSGCFSSSLSARLATTDYIKRFDSLSPSYIYVCVCVL
jgi:hypothetical protein